MTAGASNDETTQRLGELLTEAVQACEYGESTVDFEAQFVRVLKYIQAHPECAPCAEAYFVEALSAKSVCWELVSFCMYSLRFPRVKEAARQLVAAAKDDRIRAPLLHVIEAYDDAWSDAEMYDYYSSH